MMAERRLIREQEVDVIRATLERACVQPLDDSVLHSLPKLIVVSRCDCGCASIDFEATPSDERSQPVADGTGTTQRGGQVGVIIWGRKDAVTGLEVYDLGAGGDDLTLPVPESIKSWETSQSG